jgi:hypothetical protein
MAWKEITAFNVPVSTNSPGQSGVMAGKDGLVLAGGSILVISTDRGQSWTTINSFPVGGFISDISIWDENTFAVSTYASTVYFTSDQGQNWKRVTTPNIGLIAVTYLDASDHVALLDDRGVVSISLNGGLSFQTTTQGSNLGDLEYASDGTLYHLTYFDSQKKPGLYASQNLGASWILYSPTGSGDNWSMDSDPTDPNRLLIFEEEIYVKNIDFAQIHLSTDHGANWKVTSRKPLNNLSGAGTVGCHDYFAGTVDEGVLRSNDKGLTWNSIGGPAGGIDSRSVAALDDSLIFVLDQTGNIWLTMPKISGKNFFSVTPPALFTEEPVSVCDTAVRDVAFTSVGGCIATDIGSVTIEGADAASYSLDHSPLGGSLLSDSAVVIFRPSRSGKYSALLRVTLNDGRTKTVDLSLSASPRAKLDLLPLVNASTDTIGGDVAIPIRSTFTGTPLKTGFVLRFDERSIDYHGTFGGDKKDRTVSLPSKSSAFIEFDPDKDTLLWAKFSFYPVDSPCVAVTIDSIVQIAGPPNCLIATPSSLSAEICSPDSSCGRQNIARYMRFGAKPSLRIVPNPTSGDVTLFADKQIVRKVEIIDMTGIVRRVFENMTITSAGVRLATDELPSGNYLVRAGEYTALFLKQK